jgi:glycosyltransferase involved in cell wall biosynthesis
MVSDQYAPMVGGVPSVVRSLATSLARRGHTVWVLAPSAHARDERTRDERTREEGVRVRRVASCAWPFYAGQRVALPPLAAALRFCAEAQPDVLHVHSPLGLGLVARRAGRCLGLPVIATHHYLPTNINWSLGARTTVAERVYAYLVWFYNGCTLVSAPTRTALHPLRTRGLLVPARAVSNGVDLHAHFPGPPDPTVRRQLGLSADRPLVLHVNRLSPEKRIDVLLEAAARMQSDAQIALVGAGPAEADLRAQAERLLLSERVRFLGYVGEGDLLHLRRAAQVCVVPSEAELQSLSTMEAMACGLPVVAADAWALPELVAHGSNGFLFEPGDSVALATCLDHLLSDASLRARMGARSLSVIAAHNRDRVLDQWELLYERAVSFAGCRIAHGQRPSYPREGMPCMRRHPAPASAAHQS